MPAKGTTRYKPTQEDKTKIQKLAGLGLRLKDIAHVMEVSEGTLKRHHKDDIAFGIGFTNSKVAERLYAVAMEGNVTALIFWAKTRMQWRESGPELEAETEENTRRYVNAPPQAQSYEEWIKTVQQG